MAPGCISSEPTFAGLRKTKKKKKTRGPKKRGPRKKGKRGFLWQSLTSLEMQPGAKLQRISRGLCSHTPARSVLDFESFAGRGQMLDGRVLEASQVQYKPFGKPPLERGFNTSATCVHATCLAQKPPGRACPALPRQGRDSSYRGRCMASGVGFHPKNPITGPAPKVRQRCCPRSIADGVFFHRSHALPSILLWQQDCSPARHSPAAPARHSLQPAKKREQEQFQARAARNAPGQSCCHSRIGGSNPVATAGLTPVATPGLTAGRVSGEKTLCQRYCEDSIAGRPSVLARVEGVFQMACILPERLLALVRPAFDLVLRRIRSLKRCVQACGCKIETPRYACNLAPGCISSEPTFAGLRKTKKKKTRGPKKRGPRKKGKRGFLWQSLTSLEMQPGAKLQRISRGLYFAATRLHAAF